MLLLQDPLLMNGTAALSYRFPLSAEMDAFKQIEAGVVPIGSL